MNKNVRKSFSITSDFTSATHWKAKQDERYNPNEIGINLEKNYPLVWDDEEKDFFIKDEKGSLSMAWLFHNGCLLKEN